MLQSGKYYLIFFNKHRNKNYWHQQKLALNHFCTGPDPILFQVRSPLDGSTSVHRPSLAGVWSFLSYTEDTLSEPSSSSVGVRILQCSTKSTAWAIHQRSLNRNYCPPCKFGLGGNFETMKHTRLNIIFMEIFVGEIWKNWKLVFQRSDIMICSKVFFKPRPRQEIQYVHSRSK